jgi:hypothetical protein
MEALGQLNDDARLAQPAAPIEQLTRQPVETGRIKIAPSDATTE